MLFQIIRNDITKVKADAIVNTVNSNVVVDSGVDSAIYKAAGKERLLAQRKKIGLLLPSEVGITPSFDLDAKYIIHVSGPWWTDCTNLEEHDMEITLVVFGEVMSNLSKVLIMWCMMYEGSFVRLHTMVSNNYSLTHFI